MREILRKTINVILRIFVGSLIQLVLFLINKKFIMIYIPDKSGNCPHITDLLAKIYSIYEREVANTNSKGIKVIKKLINNPKVIEELEELGIVFIDDFQNVSIEDIVFLNSFMIDNKDLTYLKSNNIEYYDLNCRQLINYQIVNPEDCAFNKGKCPYLQDLINSNIKLAKTSDAYFLVGSKERLQPLFDTIQKYCDCYIITDFEDLKRVIMEEKFDFFTKIGLSGGIEVSQKELSNYQAYGMFLIFYQNKLQELKSNQEEINNRLKIAEDNAVIQKVVGHFQDLNQDGKYLRGVLIALGKYLSNYELDQEYLNLAYAYEMFQTSILIHDDIIDNAKIRRGKETIPRRICHEYLNQSNNPIYQTDVLKLANSVAICMGDYGFFNAFTIIVQNYADHPELTKILTFFNEIVIKTIKGEILDVYLPFLEKYELNNITEEDVLNIYSFKTSWYTLIGPFFLGYILGGNKENEYLKNIFLKMGILFQLKDDILGIFGNQDIGKSNVSDIEEFKQTLLYTYVINTNYGNDFLKIYGNKNIKSSELQKIRQILVTSGTIQYINDYIEDLYNSVLDEINDLNLEDEGKSLLKGLLIYLKTREK